MLEYLNEVRDRYEAWWKNENTDPLLYIIYPEKDDADFSHLVKDWMAPDIVGPWTAWKHEFLFGQAVELAAIDGDTSRINDVCDYFQAYAEATGRTAEGYHFMFINLGASMMSAFLTGITKFNGDTIWLEMEEPLTLDQILEFDENTQSGYADTALEMMETLATRLKDCFVFGTPELGGHLDVLAAMRTTNNLLYDTMDVPEKVDAACELIGKLWFKFQKKMEDIILPRNNGCSTTAMRVLSGKPTTLGTCDFSAMISPDQFRRWVLPVLENECDTYDGRILYHLDGPGEIPHLDILLSIEKLHSIQWVPGAGNPGGLDEKYDDMYKKILNGGKKIELSGNGADPEAHKKFFEKFPAKEFYVPMSVGSKTQADTILKVLR